MFMESISFVGCNCCGQEKPRAEFYDSTINAGGKSGVCKLCTRVRVKQNRIQNADYYRAYDAMRYQADPKIKERHAQYAKTSAGKLSLEMSRKKWLAHNAEKRLAHNAVNNAVRDGRLIKPTCCGDCGAGGRIHGHHDDYQKPLDVRWLCAKCHVQIHRSLPLHSALAAGHNRGAK